MTNEETGYWIAGEETRNAIEAMLKRAAAASEKRQAFQRKHNIKSIWTSGFGNVIGGEFESTPPTDAWKPLRGHTGVFTPRHSTRAGKLVAASMDELNFDNRFGVRELFTGRAMLSAGAKKLGEHWVIIHHTNATLPADCQRIKASEYHRMLEEANEKTEAA